MTREELEGYRERLGLSTWEMAALLGADVRRYRRWKNGELPVGNYVDILLPLVTKIKETPEYAALIPYAFVGTTWATARPETTYASQRSGKLR